MTLEFGVGRIYEEAEKEKRNDINKNSVAINEIYCLISLCRSSIRIYWIFSKSNRFGAVGMERMDGQIKESDQEL